MHICVYIIIPVYNVENYLRACIESVLKQKYHNIKIILVNDGSTDNSANIINDYKYIQNIHIITKSNGGLSSARNAGLDFVFSNNICDDDVIVFLDSDDVMSDTYIQSMLESMTNDIDLMLGGVYTISQNGELIKRYSKNNAICSGLEYLSNVSLNYFSFSWGGV